MSHRAVTVGRRNVWPRSYGEVGRVPTLRARRASYRFDLRIARTSPGHTMMEQHYYADVDLPFHVWVREGTGRGSRWVLRHASDLQRGAAQRGAAGDAPQGAPRASS